MIKIKLYGETEKHENVMEPLNRYLNYMTMCDPKSSEHSRYAYIVQCLLSGDDDINADDF